MNVEAATMKIDRWKAESAYREYRALVKSGRGTKQDDELRRAYHAIARGQAVIDINAAIANAGCEAGGNPRLAIARADWEFVYAFWPTRDKVYFTQHPRRWTRQQELQNISVRMDRTGTWREATDGGKAQVPMIPPAHRPPSTSALSGYRILFEAVWVRQPPVDPLLLRAIGGPFYVVLAQWDLSPLEQAVLRAKL
jgi:hypothetical protein